MRAEELTALDLQDGDTLTVRYEGGLVAAVDVPKAGTPKRELFEGHLLAGRFTILSDAEVDDLTDAQKAKLPAQEQKPKRRQPAKRASSPAAGPDAED